MLKLGVDYSLLGVEISAGWRAIFFLFFVSLIVLLGWRSLFCEKGGERGSSLIFINIVIYVYFIYWCVCVWRYSILKTGVPYPDYHKVRVSRSAHLSVILAEVVAMSPPKLPTRDKAHNFDIAQGIATTLLCEAQASPAPTTR